MGLSIPFDNNKKKIAVAFSGGGFRAACFSLGFLSYLFRHGIEKEHIHFITSTSGGSIVALTYLANNESFDVYYKQLKDKLANKKIQRAAIEQLTLRSKYWQKKYPHKRHNIINAFAAVYDELLFNDENTKQWGNLNAQNPILWVNATEFHHGRSFRFRTDGKFGHGAISIDKGLVTNFRLADILAASSCFPGGFEPIVFPGDFCTHKKNEGLVEWQEKIKHTPKHNFDEEPKNIALMDGGIVDNQGIRALLEFYENKPKDNDSIFLVDVTSNFMDSYSAQLPQYHKFSKLFLWLPLIALETLFGIALVGFMLVIPFLLWWWWDIWWTKTLVLVGLTITTTLFVGRWVVFRGYLKEQTKGILGADDFLSLLHFIRKISVMRLWNMLLPRIKSVSSIAMDINLKSNREQQFNDFYANGKFLQPKTSVLIYELSNKNKNNFTEKVQKTDREYAILRKWLGGDYFNKLTEINSTAEKARQMATTLWFNDNEKNETRNAILACGQFTTCFNLLKYLARIELKNPGIVDKKYNDFKMELINDWRFFEKKPLFMVDDLLTPNV